MNGGYLPKVYQSFLMSATMTKDVEQLKGLVLRNPVRAVALLHGFIYLIRLQAILRLEEDEDDSAQLSQYAVR